MVRSTFQNRQFYVAKNYATGVDETSTTGDIEVKVKDDEFYFLYKGADTVLRSDRIPLKNLDYVKAIAAQDQVIPLKKIKVELSSTVNNGDPILNQDYILRIAFKQFYAPGEDNQYFKDAAVHVTSAMVQDKKEFYKAMVKSLNLAFSREVGANINSNPYLEFSAGTAGSEDGIYITEKEQTWTLGTESLERVIFDVVPTTILYMQEDVVWAEEDPNTGKYYTDLTPTKANAVVGTDALGNGKIIADMEYFFMGERGDQYRMKGWPNIVPTKYLVDANLEYNVLELHYAFTDSGVNSYRSEKDITIVSSDKAVITSIITELAKAPANLTVDTSASW